jgi:hypothetical protein
VVQIAVVQQLLPQLVYQTVLEVFQQEQQLPLPNVQHAQIHPSI